MERPGKGVGISIVLLVNGFIAAQSIQDKLHVGYRLFEVQELSMGNRPGHPSRFAAFDFADSFISVHAEATFLIFLMTSIRFWQSG